MLTILPVIFLLFIALLSLFLRRLQRGTGYAWLAALVLTLITWGGVLAIHWIQLPSLALTPWRPFDPQNADPIVFAWDAISWPLGFGLLSLALAMIFTAPARLQQQSSPLTWSANLFITALGLLAVLAATPLATIQAWTLLDLVEVVLLTRLVADQKMKSQVIIAFGAKVSGTLFLLWAMIQSQSAGLPLSYTNLQSPLGVFILLATGLRLGVLPINIPYSRALPIQRGLTTMLRMTALLSNLVILARISAASIPVNWIRLLLPLTALAALYGASMWATAKNELEGRRYWCIAFAGLAVGSVLQNNSAAVVVWGLACMISGGIILFFSIRTKALLFIPVLGLIGLVGLPYTPAAGGIAGLMAVPYRFWGFLFLISLAILVAGYARMSLLQGDSLDGLERWVFGIYPPGLVILALSFWLITLLGNPGGLIPGVWWASAIVFILAAAVFWILRVVKTQPVKVGIETSLIATAIQRVSSAFTIIFRLNWFYRLLWGIFQALQLLIEFITRVLEGEGGVLWALLLVALLLTILASRGFLG